MQQNDFGFCSFTNLSKTISLVFCDTLQLHTRPVTKPFSWTPGMDISLHTWLYKETLKIQVIIIDKLYCMYNILYRETKHHFYS